MKRLAFLSCLALAGGRLAPATPWQQRGRGVEMGGGPSETTHLLRIDPAAWNRADPLRWPTWAGELERRYVRDVEVDGVVWQPCARAARSPTRIGTDRWRFHAVHGRCAGRLDLEYAVTGDPIGGRGGTRTLDPHPRRRARRALSRCLSRERDVEFGWPDAWADRDPRFVGKMPPADRGSDPRRPPPGDALVHARHEGPDHRPRARTLVRMISRRPRRQIPRFPLCFAGRHADRRRRRPAPARHGGASGTPAGGTIRLRQRRRPVRLAVLGLARRSGCRRRSGLSARVRPAREARRLLGGFDRYNNVRSTTRTVCAPPVLRDLAARRGPQHRARSSTTPGAHWRRWTDHHGMPGSRGCGSSWPAPPRTRRGCTR